MKEFFEDYLFELIMLILALSLAISLIIYAYNCSKNETEEKCFNFFNENGYVLDSCKCYEDKLLNYERN